MSGYVLTEVLPSILEEYRNAHGLRRVPIKVDLLRPVIELRGYADRIIWERFEFATQIVIAKIEFYRGHMGVYAGKGDYARVQFSSSLNFCWQRFAVLKEMYHCILDEDQATRITNVEDLMKLGEMLVSDVFAAVEEFPPLRTEHVAEILALETLFPIELRSFYKEDYDKGDVSDYELALRYRVPERYVRMAMQKGYYEFAYRMRADNLVKLDR